jgi:hypothetical protein
MERPNGTISLVGLLAKLGEKQLRIEELEDYASSLEQQLAEREAADPSPPDPTAEASDAPAP